MVKVRAKEILMEQGHTKYWLYKRMGLGYQNLSNILDGKTTSMRYDRMQNYRDLKNYKDVFWCQPVAVNSVILISKAL